MARPGERVWENVVALTTAASPLVTAWFDTTNYTTVVITYFSAGGTNVATLEGSFDGATQDTDVSYGAALTSSATALTSVPILTPYFRMRLVQTVGNATSTKVFIQARA